MKLADPNRGANVRRNLRRWRKPLLLLLGGWFLLTGAVFVAAITYAHSQRFSQRRTEMLAEGCGMVMFFILMIAVFTVLLMADRKRSE